MAGGAAPERHAVLPTEGAVGAPTATEEQNPVTLQEGEPNLVGKPRAAKENVGKIFCRNDEVQKLQNTASSFGPTALPSLLPSENCDEFSFVMDLMKHDLGHASLSILSNRQNDLIQQRRYLDDEIAQCEMNIRAILTEQGTLREIVASTIKACDAFRSRSPMPMSFSKARNHAQETKVKRLSEANLGSKNYCQELDDICWANGWKLPIYDVFPSTAYGKYQTCITVRGVDFETDGRGECQSNPNEARSSAAEKMLGKIRSMVDKRTFG